MVWWKRNAAGVDQAAKQAWQSRSYVYAAGQPVWTARNYQQLAVEAYSRNVVAYRCVKLLAEAVGGLDWCLRREGKREAIRNHAAMRLLEQPNPLEDLASFFEAMVSYRLISGQAYVLATGVEGQAPLELYCLRPDRVQVLAGGGAHALPGGYRYRHAKGETDYPVHPVTGKSRVLAWKGFHPLSEFHGQSAVEAAAMSIDQHNQSAAWNQALLQHGARPSGALVVQVQESNPAGRLSEEQYQRLKAEVDEQFSGAQNAGRPLLLEGGLDWREMSLSPKEMDFMEGKHSSARDIALAFGVPPQMLGIPGDNSYSNLQEARLALWEQTILPLADNLARALSRWLLPLYGAEEGLYVDYDRNAVAALSPRRDAVWDRAMRADFLSDEEKRAMVLGG